MAEATSAAHGNPGAWAHLKQLLPEGRGLPQEEWRIRHRAVQFFIFGHAIGLPIFGLARGWDPAFALGEGAILALFGVASGLQGLSRKMRSGLAAMGCVLSSAILVQFWGGVIEAHFHFFVVVALISLYQDWVPFSLSIVFVALDHGLTGVLLPDWVYNHTEAIDHPWRWAVIHAVFVLSECVALITVWRANEQARAETDRVLRSTAEGLLGVDGEGKITFANPAALAMMGGTEVDLLGKPILPTLLAADGRPVYAAPVDVVGAIADGRAASFEALLRRRDGAQAPVEVLWTPIVGRPGAVIALRDLADRLRLEQERQVATAQKRELEHLREVDSFKTRFMNMAAHELNTPLTPIKVQMHLLKTHAAEPALATHQRSISLLDKNFQRLTGLVGDLLDSSRLQSDRMPVRPKPLDLAPVIHEIVDAFRPAASEASVVLEVTTPDSVPCVADPDRITQAVTNLLSNAIKFSPAGGIVRVAVERHDRHLRVSVRDNGLGMTPQQAGRLFRPFEQVHEGHAQVANKGGSGLGLYITRGIVELHGGRIWVDSPGPGQGSTFTFEIPVNAKAEDGGPAAAAGPDGATGRHAAA